MNGSVTPKVIGWTSSGSGSLRMSRIRWFCQAQRPKATPNASRAMTIRLRSSSRCSTTDSRSSCEIGLMRRMRALALGLLLGRLGGDWLGLLGALLGGGRQLVLVLAGHRVLELAHTPTQRTPEIGQPLGPEDDQHDDQDDD